MRSFVVNAIYLRVDLQIYDFFQTFELEVEYIWKPPFTPFKMLYIFMKYLPYIDVSLLIIRARSPSLSAGRRTDPYHPSESRKPNGQGMPHIQSDKRM